jgi:hypothetical protein
MGCPSAMTRICRNGGASMPRQFYLHEHKRSDKPPVWCARFRGVDGTVGSAVHTGQSAREAAENWAIERLLHGVTVKSGEPRVLTSIFSFEGH